METYHIKKYQKDFYEEWNNFLVHSKNATFLFHRDFMEYHSDRFTDFSLMVYKGKQLVALLPANKNDNVVWSHQGLTYGGLVLQAKIKFRNTIAIFQTVLQYLQQEAIGVFNIKIIPTIYVKQPNDELLYLMFLVQAKLLRRDSLSVLNLMNKPKYSTNRVEGKKRGIKNQLVIKEEDSLDAFWNEILIKNLQNKHQAKPVHTLAEISCLKHKFPKNIRQFNVYKDDVIVAGTTIFETEQVAHSQYISGNEDKNALGSLDFLHFHLFENVFNNKMYFDLGTSNENNGLKVNEGLQYWKEGFGARTITQDFYEIEVENHTRLKSVLI